MNAGEAISAHQPALKPVRTTLYRQSDAGADDAKAYARVHEQAQTQTQVRNPVQSPAEPQSGTHAQTRAQAQAQAQAQADDAAATDADTDLHAPNSSPTSRRTPLASETQADAAKTANAKASTLAHANRSTDKSASLRSGDSTRSYAPKNHSDAVNAGNSADHADSADSSDSSDSTDDGDATIGASAGGGAAGITAGTTAQADGAVAPPSGGDLARIAWMLGAVKTASSAANDQTKQGAASASISTSSPRGTVAVGSNGAGVAGAIGEAADDVGTTGSSVLGDKAQGSDAVIAPILPFSLLPDAANSASRTVDPMSVVVAGAAPGLPPTNAAQAATSANATASSSLASMATTLGTAPIALDQPGWTGSLGTHLHLQLAQGVQEATLELHPRDWGMLQIHLKIVGSEAQLQFSTAHPQARAALEAGLPELRAQLANDGLKLQTQVDQQQQSRQQTFRPAFVTAERADEAEANAAPQIRSIRIGLVDDFA